MVISKYARWAMTVGFAALTGCSNSDSGGSTCADATASNCGDYCAYLQVDANNCGACGAVCATGQTCSAGVCTTTCSSPSTQCTSGCTNTMTDSSNCGACGTVCPTTTPYCSAGVCAADCGAGLSKCDTSCVDVASDSANCGSCFNACPTGYSCVTSVCTATGTGGANGSGGASATAVGTTASTGGTGTGGTSSTGTSTGGTSATGGTTAAVTAADLTCSYTGTDGTAKTLTVSAADVISDFAEGKNLMYSTTTRGGTAWYSYSATTESDPSTTSTTTAFNIDTATVGPCNRGGSLHAMSPGNTGYGVGMGVNLMPDAATGKKGIFTNTEGYTGIGFFMKCSAETTFAFFKIPDEANDADVVSPVCTYSSSPICNQYGVKNNVILANQWTYYPVYFSEAVQDWDSSSFGSGLNANALTAFQVQVNTRYDRGGTTKIANPFECWIDDVHFIKTAAPTTTAPSGGYTTSGNKIYGPDGAEVRLRGLARPSFEWDRAGFGITREDIQRMKTWGINVVRFSVNQPWWQDSVQGGVYQKSVKRAVNWALQENLAVIIDLHWTGTTEDYGQKPMAYAEAINFWTDVASVYKSDRRVIFELYNEPYGVSSDQWRNGDSTYAGMQEMYDAVRNAGADNLVLIGGLDYAYDLSHVYANSTFSSYAITGENFAYVTHPYQWKATESSIPTAYGNLAAVAPVMATEFGDAGSSIGGGSTATSCNESQYTRLLTDFQTRGMSYTGWAWLVDSERCMFPALIDSYDGADTTEAGAIVKAWLQAGN